MPRHEFVPEFYERGTDPVGPMAWELVSASSPDTRERWWNGVWANTSLVTQLGDLSRWEPRATTGPTSSSSAPSLMTRMLEALDIRDGHRVLEIGTGTGYNAALMSHRLGQENVFSVDVDAELVDSARSRLAALGYRPTLAAVDGITGLPEHAPYDRIIATCAVSRVPWSWAEQTTEDGLILVDLKIRASVGNLVLLRREADRLEGRFDAGYATFMHLRTPAFHVDPRPDPPGTGPRRGGQPPRCGTNAFGGTPRCGSCCTCGSAGGSGSGTRWTPTQAAPAPCSFPARTAHGANCRQRTRVGPGTCGKAAPAACG
ncbi:MAG: methyltransferase domain-containing protein [Pseudonocardiaceae bacterium]